MKTIAPTSDNSRIHLAPTLESTVALSWDRIEEAMEGLASQIRALGQLDGLIAIARGGLVPATMLSHRLGIRRVHTIQVSRNLSDAPRAYGPGIAERLGQLGPLAGRFVLVEDIVYTAASLRAVHTDMQETCQLVAAAAVVCDAGKAPLNLGVIPILHHFTCKEDLWIRFPWERPLHNEVPWS